MKYESVTEGNAKSRRKACLQKSRDSACGSLLFFCRGLGCPQQAK